jgi:hypothetical protein
MTNDDTVMITTSAHYDLMQAQLKGCENEVARLRELLSHRSFADQGQKESDVVSALRSLANRVRAHSGFDPGQKYDALADEIAATVQVKP